ncbi:MAG: YicC family protein [Bacteroidetes bacterium]|nr:MAG: YicC family protein [Bacteroidota bacterium]
MMQSMTGYGKMAFEDEKRKIMIEIRCLNSKQFDFNYKSSGILKDKEALLRALVNKQLKRGKIEMSIFYYNLEDPAVPLINKEVVRKYYEQITNLQEGNVQPDFLELLPVILKLPDVLKTDKQKLEEEEWETINKHVIQVINDVNAFRDQEGNSLEKDIRGRVILIRELLQRIIPFEKERLEKIKIRIKERLNELSNSVDYDKNRFEQELIYYLEKLDITEEKTRLNNHIDYFISSIKTDEAIGKKLGFISQELGREINTIGSKANNADIQKIVVMMKDELEKIKEQLLNVL